MGHGVVDVLDTAIGAWVVRAGVDRVHAKAVEDGVGELRGKVQPVVGDEGNGVPPQRYVLVDEDVGVGDGGKLGCRHCVYVGAATEAVGEKGDSGVTAWGKGQRAEVFDDDGDAGAVG